MYKPRMAIVVFCVLLVMALGVDSASAQRVVSISSGPFHCLALGDDGSVWQWGSNFRGVLNGDSNDTNSYGLMKVQISNVTMISAGMFSNLALKNDGTVWTWGRNASGGDGFAIPVQVPISSVKAVYAGKACFAVKDDGTVWAWGDNSGGHLGDGTLNDSVTLVQVKIQNISEMDGVGVFAVKDGSVWAWGYNVYDVVGDKNYYGYLGDNSPNTTRPTPFIVDGLSNVKAVSAGQSHILVLKNDGTVWAWGKNDMGQLGNGKKTGIFEYTNTPINIGLNNVKAVSANGYQSMALKNDGTVWTWGSIAGSLALTPRMVQGLNGVIAISAGVDHCMALKDDGTVWTWGSSSPVQVKIDITGTPIISSNPARIVNNTMNPTSTPQSNGFGLNTIELAGILAIIGCAILHFTKKGK